jgi:hypothetical protein
MKSLRRNEGEPTIVNTAIRDVQSQLRGGAPIEGDLTIVGDLTLTGNATLTGDHFVDGTITLENTGLHILDSNATHDLIIVPGSNLAADRTLTLTTGDANRVLTITADSSIGGTAYVSGGTDVAVADGGTGQSTAAEAIGELTQACTEDTTPDRLLDMAAVYDASADTGSKVALWRLAGQAVLASGSMSGGSLDLPLDLTGYSNFKLFKLYLLNAIPATDGAAAWLRFSDDGGATFEADAADYQFGGDIADASDSEIELSAGIGNDTGEQAAFEVTIFNPAGAGRTQILSTGVYLGTAGGINHVNVAGGALVAGASTDVRFMFSTGNITSGTYTLVGII